MIVRIEYVLNNETTSGFASYNMYIKEGKSATSIMWSTLFPQNFEVGISGWRAGLRETALYVEREWIRVKNRIQ